MAELVKWREAMKSHVFFFALMIGSALIEGVFIVLWWLIQWFVGKYVMELFPLAQLDAVTGVCFQIVLAIATLAPILIYSRTDIMVMWYKAQRRINAEKGRRDAEKGDDASY